MPVTHTPDKGKIPENEANKDSALESQTSAPPNGGAIPKKPAPKDRGAGAVNPTPTEQGDGHKAQAPPKEGAKSKETALISGGTAAAKKPASHRMQTRSMRKDLGLRALSNNGLPLTQEEMLDEVWVVPRPPNEDVGEKSTILSMIDGTQSVDLDVGPVTAMGIRTITHKIGGTKEVTMYGQIVEAGGSEGMHIQRRPFIEKYGFDPENGEIHKRFLIHKLPKEWAEKVLKSDSEMGSIESDATRIGDDNLEETVIQNPDADSVCSWSKHKARPAQPPSITAIRGNKDLSDEDRKALNDKIQSMQSWDAWIKLTVKENDRAKFKGTLPGANCRPFNIVNAVDKEAITSLLNGKDEKMIELAMKHESLVSKDEVYPLKQSKEEEDYNIGCSLEKTEVVCLYQWFRFRYAVSYFRACRRMIRDDGVLEADLGLICQMVPFLRKQYDIGWTNLRQTTERWEKRMGKSGKESATLRHCYQLMNDIFKNRSKSMRDEYTKLMMDVQRKIIPLTLFFLRREAGIIKADQQYERLIDDDDNVSIATSNSNLPSRDISWGTRSGSSSSMSPIPPTGQDDAISHLQNEKRQICEALKKERDIFYSVPNRSREEHLQYKAYFKDTQKRRDRIGKQIQELQWLKVQRERQDKGPQFESTRNVRSKTRTTPKDRLGSGMESAPARTSTSVYLDEDENYSRLERTLPGDMTQAQILPRYLSAGEVRKEQQRNDLGLGTNPNMSPDDQATQRQARSTKRIEDTFTFTKQDIVGHNRQPVPPRNACGGGNTPSTINAYGGLLTRSKGVTKNPPTYEGGDFNAFRKRNQFHERSNVLEQIDNPAPERRENQSPVANPYPDRTLVRPVMDGRAPTETMGTWRQDRENISRHINQYQTYRVNQSDHRFSGRADLRYNAGDHQSRIQSWEHDEDDSRSSSQRDHRDDGRDDDRGNGRFPPYGGGGPGDGDDPDPEDEDEGASLPPPPPPNPGPGQQVAPDMNGFMRHFVRAMQMAANQPPEIPPDVLDGFLNVETMERWYLALPSPWNKVPKLSGKKGEILKNMAMVFDTEKTYFQGRNDGSFFTWRALVIENLHRQPITVAEKVIQLQRITNKDHPLLKTICGAQSFTCQTYGNLIVNLEINFGGTTRAKNYLREQLLNGEPLDWYKVSSVQLLRARIDKYLEHLVVHGIPDQAHNIEIFNMVISNTMSKYLATQFRKDAIDKRFTNPDSIQAVSEWLEDREIQLKWADTHHTEGMKLVKSRNPASTRSRRTFLTESQDPTDESQEDHEREEISESAFPTHPSKRFIQNEPLRTDRNRGGFQTSPIRQERKPLEETAMVVEEETDVSDTDSLQTTHDVCAGMWDLEEEDMINCLTTFRQRLPICSVCKKDRHILRKCEKFQNMDLAHRTIVVNQERRCDNCLHPSHQRRDCKSQYRCQKEGCGRKHHTLLHYPDGAKGAPGTKISK